MPSSLEYGVKGRELLTYQLIEKFLPRLKAQKVVALGLTSRCRTRVGLIGNDSNCDVYPLAIGSGLNTAGGNLLL